MSNSIFEQIKKINEYQKEYWSARDLSKLLGYTEMVINILPAVFTRFFSSFYSH